MRLTLDLETLPALSMTAEDRQRYAYSKAPKDHPAPAEWLAENTEEQWRRSALDLDRAVIWMVGYAWDDAHPRVLVNPDPEGDPGWCVREFWAAVWSELQARAGRSIAYPRAIVGKYHRHFDLPMLARQAFRVGPGAEGLALWLTDVLSYPYDKRVCCPGERIPGKSLSLDPMAQLLGVSGKPDGMDGSRVYDYFLEGRVDEVAAYCAADVMSARACWDVLVGNTPAPGGVLPPLPDVPADILEALTT